MYKTSYLLEKLDAFTVSIKDRLTPEDLQMLEDIRVGIEQSQSEKEVEEYFFSLLNLMLILKDYFDNLS